MQIVFENIINVQNYQKNFDESFVKTLGTVKNKIGSKYDISSIKVILNNPEINAILIKLITILSKIWANGKKLYALPFSSIGTLESFITVSKALIKFLWFI